eukprot:TRINITY_DN646_c0_g6_i1.p1 TRINITY_DN646_c0_g6~~TRINITY_DN646_c0_g6_i1.p1  ORF type:complete len:210 (-),score=43.27 TRINITY_DN646_c0_g6_i1:213-842(-)
MRRDGLYHTSRTLRQCCAGRYHKVPQQQQEHENKPTSEDRVANCCGSVLKGAKRCYGNNYSHIARCGMCKPGRRHGAGGAKSRKRLGGYAGGMEKLKWEDIRKEASEAHQAYQRGKRLDTDKEDEIDNWLASSDDDDDDDSDSFSQIPHVHHRRFALNPPASVPAKAPVARTQRKKHDRSKPRFATFGCKCCKQSAVDRSLSDDDWVLV